MSTKRLRMPGESNTAAWFFLAPALTLIFVFFFLPVAASLVLSERTVARHIANIYVKAGTHGRAEITAYALRHRIV